MPAGSGCSLANRRLQFVPMFAKKMAAIVSYFFHITKRRIWLKDRFSARAIVAYVLLRIASGRTLISSVPDVPRFGTSRSLTGTARWFVAMCLAAPSLKVAYFLTSLTEWNRLWSQLGCQTSWLIEIGFQCRLGNSRDGLVLNPVGSPIGGLS